jgi:hypothetical protein
MAGPIATLAILLSFQIATHEGGASRPRPVRVVVFFEIALTQMGQTHRITLLIHLNRRRFICRERELYRGRFVLTGKGCHFSPSVWDNDTAVGRSGVGKKRESYSGLGVCSVLADRLRASSPVRDSSYESRTTSYVSGPKCLSASNAHHAESRSHSGSLKFAHFADFDLH